MSTHVRFYIYDFYFYFHKLPVITVLTSKNPQHVKLNKPIMAAFFSKHNIIHNINIVQKLCILYF